MYKETVVKVTKTVNLKAFAFFTSAQQGNCQVRFERPAIWMQPSRGYAVRYIRGMRYEFANNRVDKRENDTPLGRPAFN